MARHRSSGGPRTPPRLDPRLRDFRHPAMKQFGRDYVLQNPGRFGIDLEVWATEHGDDDADSGDDT